MRAKALRKGDRVVMHSSMEAKQQDGELWTCKNNEFKLHPTHNYSVLMLDGCSESFATECLQKVDI